MRTSLSGANVHESVNWLATGHEQSSIAFHIRQIIKIIMAFVYLTIKLIKPT
jgi:hypothetical protein